MLNFPEKQHLRYMGSKSLNFGTDFAHCISDIVFERIFPLIEFHVPNTHHNLVGHILTTLNPDLIFLETATSKFEFDLS